MRIFVVKRMITASGFSFVTNLPKLMTSRIDFTANQITGRLLYPLSDGFLNEAVIYTMRLAGRNVSFFWEHSKRAHTEMWVKDPT